MEKGLSRTLAKEAKKKGICKEWLAALRSLNDREAMVDMYLRGIDFCLRNDYPTNNFIKAHFADIAPRMGVFVDSEISVENRPKCVCLGATFGVVKTNNFNVTEIFAKHHAELNVVAADNAFVMIDVFDNSVVNIHAHDRAKVCVNKYGDGGRVNIVVEEAEAQVKIRVKNQKTY